MKKFLIWGIGIFTVIAVIAVATAEEEKASTPQAGTETIQPQEAAEPDPEPEGEFGLASCDVDLGDGFDNYRLLGSTELHNTGEVKATVTVKFAWLLGDGSRVKADPKTVTLDAGTERLVFFKVPVAQNVVDLFQGHPKYFESENCKTQADIS